MSTREIFSILILIFITGFISSQVVGSNLPELTVPFMAMVGGFIAVALNRLKHLDDLNLARKKDAALEYIKYVSEYRSAILNVIDQSVSNEVFHSQLIEATKNMVAALDQLHVVSNDIISNKIELKNAEVVSLMSEIQKKSQEYPNDKISLIKWFVEADFGSRLNLIRYEIIDLVNSEIGDGSGTKLFKEAIVANNKHFKQLFTNAFKK
ncbi:hypothetical protein FM038_020130 [Shewanella eurypsychrophilus]|uniref:Uncharacterized protein n=1 Tax=Shewanella eurypsychrophilus TaxID=2593656 RepID=A0ABX6VC97_9GAMM|nr:MULTISPECIES: hypothetical protein [Shewanella]QFU24233.1 hypothetical protein FS418_21855 [Shewanella sp. YLB-09]QPG59438.1 hypothetical protein FM038_020130 [Shewanella eurypsychrophilus]